MIVRALGMKETVQVDVMTKTPRIGNTYLLCSDGLSGMITDDQMAAILSANGDLHQAVHSMIDAANEQGGVDIISVILARIEQP